MTNLKELSVSELHQQIKNATDELINRELEADKPFRTVKRVAEVGERVVIVNPIDTHEGYKTGDIFTVLGLYLNVAEVNGHFDDGSEIVLFHEEYEVIIDDEHPRVVTTKPFNLIKSKNQQRAELIQRAGEFVKNAGKESRGRTTYIHGGYRCIAEFIVNSKKRTVVCLLRGAGTNTLRFRGIARGIPGDVFNEWIGKAIALARALEIEIPEEFLEAVQPDEIVKGQQIEYLDGSLRSCTRVIEKIYDDRIRYQCGKNFFIHVHEDPNDLIGDLFKIINDTNAIYESGDSQ